MVLRLDLVVAVSIALGVVVRLSCVVNCLQAVKRSGQVIKLELLVGCLAKRKWVEREKAAEVFATWVRRESGELGLAARLQGRRYSWLANKTGAHSGGSGEP